MLDTLAVTRSQPAGPLALAPGAMAPADDEIDLRELWRAIKRRQRWAIATGVLVVGLAGAITAYQRIFQPVYEGSFLLLINDPVNNDSSSGNGSSSIGGQDSVIKQLALNNTSGNDLPTLQEVLKSPMILGPVAKAYGLSSAELSNRIKISPGSSSKASEKAEGILNVTVQGKQPAKDQQLLEAISQAYLHYSLNQRQQRLSDGLKFLDSQFPSLEARNGQLQSDLAQFRIQNDQLQPLEEGVAIKTQLYQLQNQRRELAFERARLQTVRAGIVAGSLSARAFEEAVGSGAATASAGSQGVTVAGSNQSLLEQLNTIDKQLADARARYSDDSAMVEGLQARRKRLLPLLISYQLEAVDAALNLNTGRSIKLNQQLNSMNGEFKLQPTLIKQYSAIEQKLKIAQENLESFLKARQSFQLEIAQRSVPWKVIAPPTINPDPIKPSVPRNLALGGVLGLVLGLGVAILRDRLDHVFHHASEVEAELGLPLLSHIPYIPSLRGLREDKRVMLEAFAGFNSLERPEETAKAGTNNKEASEPVPSYQRFFFQEAFRNLYTSLRFLNSEKTLRSIALTSSLPAEGKSMMSILLAKTLSELGQRVLLVDADLRKPQMHHRLGVDNLVGLSNILSDDQSSWQEAIQPVANQEHWWVLTAGRRPPDPARLLSSHRMHKLAKDLADSGDFDLIIYDTPPSVGLSDAALIAEHLDGLILVVSLNRVDRHLPKEAINRLKGSGTNVLGVVTNALKQERHSDHPYYGARYGYRYGYGYGGYGYQTLYNYYGKDDAAANPATPKKGKLKAFRQRLLGWLEN